MTVPGNGEILFVATGIAATGPILVVDCPPTSDRQASDAVAHTEPSTKMARLLDGKSLQEIRLTDFSSKQMRKVDWQKTRQIVAAQDGSAFAVVGPNVAVQAVGNFAKVYSLEFLKQNKRDQYGRRTPGTYARQDLSVFLPQSPRRPGTARQSVPAANWPGTLIVTSTERGIWGRLHLHGLASSVAQIPLSPPAARSGTKRNKAVPQPDVLFIPEAELIVVQQQDQRSWRLHHFGVVEALRKLNQPVLAVSGRNAPAAVAGERISFTPAIIVQGGDELGNSVTMKLVTGPAGMSVDDAGTLTWTAPADIGIGFVDADVLVTAGKLSVRRTYQFPIVGPGETPASVLPLRLNSSFAEIVPVRIA